MIVGNGDIPAGAAEIIYLCDLVIRFNDCRSVGAGGAKTDIVAVCNTGRPGKTMTTSPEWRDSEPVRHASAIWSVRDPGKFAQMHDGILAQHPELDDFCEDYSAGFAAIAKASGKEHHIIPRAVHDELDTALSALSPEPYVCPSSGLIVLAYLLGLAGTEADRIVITGFGHQGWDGHPFIAEKQLVDAFEAAGKLTRLSHNSLFSASQGA